MPTEVKRKANTIGRGVPTMVRKRSDNLSEERGDADGPAGERVARPCDRRTYATPLPGTRALELRQILRRIS